MFDDLMKKRYPHGRPGEEVKEEAKEMQITSARPPPKQIIIPQKPKNIFQDDEQTKSVVSNASSGQGLISDPFWNSQQIEEQGHYLSGQELTDFVEEYD